MLRVYILPLNPVIEVSVLSQEGEWSCICVLSVTSQESKLSCMLLSVTSQESKLSCMCAKGNKPGE